MPTAIAASTKKKIDSHGTAKTTPSLESAWVTSTARKTPTTMPSAAPISDVTTLS